MPLDLTQLKNKKTRWVSFDGHLQGVEFLVTLSTPRESMVFRNRLISLGILSRDAASLTPLPGKEGDYFREFAERFVLDWRVAEGYPADLIKPPDAKYNADDMGLVLGAYGSVYQKIQEAAAEENAFFQNGQPASTQS